MLSIALGMILAIGIGAFFIIWTFSLSSPSDRQDTAVELCQQKFAYIEEVTAFKGVSRRTLCLDITRDVPKIVGTLEN